MQQIDDLWGCPAILCMLKKKLEKIQSGEQGPYNFCWEIYILRKSVVYLFNSINYFEIFHLIVSYWNILNKKDGIKYMPVFMPV